MTKRITTDQAILRFRKRRGMMALIARELGLREATIWCWVRIPIDHVFRVAQITRVPVEQLRPDFFINDPLRRNLISPTLLATTYRRKPNGHPRLTKSSQPQETIRPHT